MNTSLDSSNRSAQYSTKPQKEWGWEIALYLYLAGMGSGSFIIGVLLDWLGYATPPESAVYLWGPVPVAFGSLFLMLHLGNKKRFLNAGLNPKTSWVSRGFFILSVFIIFGGATLVVSLLPLLITNQFYTLLRILETVSFIFAAGTAVYTGILLKSSRHVSLWNTWLLPLLFLVSALSTGSMLIIFSGLGTSFFPIQSIHLPQVLGLVNAMEKIFIGLESLILAIYLFFGHQNRAEGAQAKNSVRLLVSGNLKYIFWIGVVISGIFFPIILEIIYSVSEGSVALLVIAGIFLLISGFLLRFGILAAGMKDKSPLYRMGEMQLYWKDPVD